MLLRSNLALAGLLAGGWRGTYGQLAVAIGRTAKSGRVIGNLVRGYAKRNPTWDHRNGHAKETGLPAYLESSSPANVPLYRRHGFEVVEVLKAAPDAPEMWAMWREPHAGA